MIDLARSYCGPAPAPDVWWSTWNGDPVLLAGLLIAGAAVLRLPPSRRRYGVGAVAALALAFVSPLCGLTTALFAARAVHHLVLFAVAAPLLAAAWPRRPVRGGGAGVPAALMLSTVMLWAWHWPVAYDAALGNVAIYWAMQVGLIVSAWAFWNALRHAAPAEATMGIVGGAVQMGFLGAVLTFAMRPLYAAHATTTASFGIGPLADQQYAGLVMWVPGMVPYAVAVAWLARRGWATMARGGAAA